VKLYLTPSDEKTVEELSKAVVAEEQRQLEMDFAARALDVVPAKEAGDEQVRTAIDGLGELETALKYWL